MKNGKFVISLDFEMHWGFFDIKTLDECRSQLSNISMVIDKLLQLSQQYNTSITFATVGKMFAKDKSEVLKYIPDRMPDYRNSKLNAYNLLNNIAAIDQEFYFAQDLIKKIKADTLHEIGTHTFCHYYCYESGQNIEDFKEDLTSAIAIANNLDITIKSIVFPRNQVQKNYLQACEDLGIETYRGNCWFNFSNDARKLKLKEYGLVAIRVLDTYFNISGSNSFKLDDYNSKNSKLINIPASRFLRPYHSQLKFMEGLKVNRIKKGMTQAAKRNEVYHLWWHPHNFANNIEENFKNFSDILQHYAALNTKYNFESITMQRLGGDYRSS